jgi:hypothetical protein
MRHDRGGAHLPYSICKALDFKTKKSGKHLPPPTRDPEDVTVIRDQGVQTGTGFIANN